MDGVHFNVRLGDDRLCTLVMIGARPDGTKELIAVEDGYRESAESWKALLRDLKRRGMRPPVVAVGDGALGFWAALRDVWPKTRAQRDWFHKLANILDTLPRRLQPRAKGALHEVMYAETREHAREAITRFADDYSAKYPKAPATLERDADALLTFFDFPAEHWKHLRTSNVIESPFATVRLRQRVTKAAGSRTKGLLRMRHRPVAKILMRADSEGVVPCSSGAALVRRAFAAYRKMPVPCRRHDVGYGPSANVRS